MQTRRSFLHNLSVLGGAAGLSMAGLLEPIQKALAIEPAEGSSYLDAEHVVILMQENRSFDHSFGTLQGVRGFNDPRAIELPNGNPVWAQTNKEGETYIPFHLDLRESKSTWMGCLPHGWTDQVDATNGGKHDRWLDTKRSGHKEYAEMPLTLGYHTREDIPFYYALADAFTIGDQNFCSTLTGTTPNRLHLWTGTIREKPDPNVYAVVRNEDCDYGSWCNWRTFPELLESHGVPWKIYQNELTVPNGLTGEADAWLGNFGCNPIEWFTQFGVRFAPKHREYLKRAIGTLEGEQRSNASKLQTTEAAADKDQLSKRQAEIETSLKRLRTDLETYSEENFEKLSPEQKSLFARAFVTNSGDPAYRELTELTYREGEKSRLVQIPKGDVLHQFRKDVADGQLPTVSWLVPPERFSDHPCSAWYGQWYLSEILHILTSNPEVWKKTIFILTYDENDGYFDHVPPFQAPHPKKPESGKASPGLDTTLDHLELEVDRKKKPRSAVRGNSLGLGYRVPLIIASPWSRGGCVYSEVCDHTSPIQFLEQFLTHKTGKKIEETNITAWRRAICSDLTASFQPAAESTVGLKDFVKPEEWIETIHRARYKDLPKGFHPLMPDEIAAIRDKKLTSEMPTQEPGVRTACALPYDLSVDGSMSKEGDAFHLRFESSKVKLGERAAGAAFILYAKMAKGLVVRHYTVAAGEAVEEILPLRDFENGAFQVRIHGPNGFFREYKGEAKGPAIKTSLLELPTGDLELQVMLEKGPRQLRLQAFDRSYGARLPEVIVGLGETASATIPASQSGGWYDFAMACDMFANLGVHFAGKVETARWTTTDPAMA